MIPDTSRAALITLVNMPGYQVLLDIFEFEVRNLEQQVFMMNPAQESAVLAAHRIALGARWGFEETKKHVEREAQLPKQQQPLTQKEQEELYIKSLQ